VTACCGSGSSSAAGVHAWHRPHQPCGPSSSDELQVSTPPLPSLSMPSNIWLMFWKFFICHLAAGPAQVKYWSHFDFAVAPHITSGCVAQPGALLNAASYFSSGDLTDAPIQRTLVDRS